MKQNTKVKRMTQKEQMRKITKDRLENGAMSTEILESKNHKSLCALRKRTQKNMAGNIKLRNLFEIAHAMRGVK